jgi:hypothetical protein
MLLRRVIAHFRQQEWTAIVIDLVIVVTGVFIGIQVSNWNAARAERADERALLVRLHEETRALLEVQKSEFADQSPRVEALTAVHPLLFDQAPGRAPTDVECRLIAISHYLPVPTDELPILEEAISTGRFELISNQNIKANLRSFALVRDRSRRQHAESINELYRLTSRHPDAVWYARVAGEYGEDPILLVRRDPAQWARRAGEGFRWANGCDLDKMRGDKAFLAEYVDNVLRLNAFLERYEKLIGVLTGLEASLAAELGVPGSSDAGADPR